MKPLKLIAAALLPMLLSACLEVDQNPPYVDGAYAGKRDNLQTEYKFHGDKLAWNAAISDRNLGQNEYNRAKP
jgi:hypothetical protein